MRENRSFKHDINSYFTNKRCGQERSNAHAVPPLVLRLKKKKMLDFQLDKVFLQENFYSMLSPFSQFRAPNVIFRYSLFVFKFTNQLSVEAFFALSVVDKTLWRRTLSSHQYNWNYKPHNIIVMKINIIKLIMFLII